MKSIISIGEDGNGLGWNKVCKDEVLQKLYADVGKNVDVLKELEFDGLVFILEESSIDDWADVERESIHLEYVEYADLLKKVKEVIAEEIQMMNE